MKKRIDVMPKIHAEPEVGGELMDAVSEGLWPFRPRHIVLVREFDMDYKKYKLLVEAYFQDMLVPVVVFPDADSMLDDLEAEVDRLCGDIVHQLRRRPRVSSDHHLGEE